MEPLEPPSPEVGGHPTEDPKLLPLEAGGSPAKTAEHRVVEPGELGLGPARLPGPQEVDEPALQLPVESRGPVAEPAEPRALEVGGVPAEPPRNRIPQVYRPAPKTQEVRVQDLKDPPRPVSPSLIPSDLGGPTPPQPTELEELEFSRKVPTFYFSPLR